MMKQYLPPLLSGGLFGAGLALGGMTDPARVRGFLDLFGNWDPTLAFVMGGAVLVMAIAWRIQPRMAQPLFGLKFAIPDRSDLTPKLIGGSALFGIGWGVAGLCPGPAITALVIEPVSAAIFVAAMLAGMLLVRLVEKDA
ncbi:DUF6691 family protein [Erythrobacter sp. EC-HK427]|uniref:DUF6691 family protein n=1 Tax=Erythrobacter sp. EC-HK427 TaxID=2038396 RepID=UPI0012586D0F|nr:DUF6691 family protein [Erythrobacter sp. EC-HK427]VVS98984.1 conserved membrane hypothetical protein [Erythrobacter sp. EC-HK427]